MEMKNENLKFYTTEKQSEKLLNAGLPANSADCYFGLLSKNPCSDNDEYFPREIIIRQNIKQLSPDFFETEIGKEFLHNILPIFAHYDSDECRKLCILQH